MASFVIEGGHRLSGEIHPQGAKNEVLQIICATLLTAEEVTVNNIPDILDVNNLIQLMREMGVTVAKEGVDTYSFKAENVDLAYLESDEFLKKCSSLRGSVMLIGPMVARFGKALISKPGGDKIGRRRLDTHFVGIQNLGADFRYDESRGIYEITADRLQGSYMLLDEASVTGTANILMAAVLAKGTTTIYNAACEPYLQQLCRMLNRMGAKISGIASNLLTIEGVEELHGTQHTVLPDMIEVGSFIGMAAMTKSEITIKNVSYENLGIIPESFRRLGIKLEQRGDDIYVPAQETYEIESFIDGSIMTIADAPWPGLTPDLLSVMLVVATQAKGSVLIHQKMFESRLFFVDKLIDMGAQIILCDPHRAVVIGHNHGFKLRGARLTSPDIRAGIALLIAAMSAEGTSTISNIEQIDRGYQNIEGRLNAIGARITRHLRPCGLRLSDLPARRYFRTVFHRRIPFSFGLHRTGEARRHRYGGTRAYVHQCRSLLPGEARGRGGRRRTVVELLRRFPHGRRSSRRAGRSGRSGYRYGEHPFCGRTGGRRRTPRPCTGRIYSGNQSGKEAHHSRAS